MFKTRESLKLALLSLLGTSLTVNASVALADEAQAPVRDGANNEDTLPFDENLAFDQGAGYVGRRQDVTRMAEASAAPEAREAATVVIGLGTSLPTQGDTRYDIPAGAVANPLPGAISRRDGGELFTMDFVDQTFRHKNPIKISAIRLIAYSKSGAGKVKINGAAVVSKTGTVKKIEGLSSMMKAGDVLTVRVDETFEAASFRLGVEAFANGDASIVMIIQHSVAEMAPKLYGVFHRKVVNPATETRVPSRPSAPTFPSTPSRPSRPVEPDPEPVEPPGHEREGANTYGGTRYYSRGGHASTYGNSTYYSNGGHSSTYGNSTYFSNGGHSSTYGNTTYFSNGGHSSTYGNTTYFSNGGHCSVYGSSRYCS